MRQVVFSAAVFCVTAAAVHAQGVYYSTTFSTNANTPDTYNNAPLSGFAPYTSSPTAPVVNLAGQNGWATSDPVGATGGTQVNGGTNYVGVLGAGGNNFFAGQFGGAVGGIERNPTPTTSAPDVVPSTTSAGLVSLYHALPTIGTQLVMNLDFAVTGSSASFPNTDSFAFSLRSADGTKSLISINFVPPTTSGTGQDNITVTAGGATTGTTTGSGVVFNAQYHLKLTINPGASPQFGVTITDSANALAGSFSGSIAGGPITLQDVARFSADWSLADKATNANGGLTGAGDNSLLFDNLTIAVPEPATDAMLALGLLGLVALARSRRQRA